MDCTLNFGGGIAFLCSFFHLINPLPMARSSDTAFPPLLPGPFLWDKLILAVFLVRMLRIMFQRFQGVFVVSGIWDHVV